MNNSSNQTSDPNTNTNSLDNLSIADKNFLDKLSSKDLNIEIRYFNEMPGQAHRVIELILQSLRSIKNNIVREILNQKTDSYTSRIKYFNKKNENIIYNKYKTGSVLEDIASRNILGKILDEFYSIDNVTDKKQNDIKNWFETKIENTTNEGMFRMFMILLILSFGNSATLTYSINPNPNPNDTIIIDATVYRYFKNVGKLGKIEIDKDIDYINGIKKLTIYSGINNEKYEYNKDTTNQTGPKETWNFIDGEGNEVPITFKNDTTTNTSGGKTVKKRKLKQTHKKGKTNRKKYHKQSRKKQTSLF
jgi:hypothetical protein